MRGVMVAVALCALVSGAEAKEWQCQNLGARICVLDKCEVQQGAPRYMVTAPEGSSVEDGEVTVVTPISKTSATFMVFVSDKPGATVNYGYCWPLKQRR